MVIERRPMRSLALLLLLVLAPLPLLWAQNSTETRFVHLAWTPDEYTLRFEVIIEREDGGRYHRVLQKFTDTFFIELSLELGKYRCRVIPYDFLEKPGEGSQWISFEIRPAYVPPPPEPAKGEITVVYPEIKPEPIEPKPVLPEPAPEPAEPGEKLQPPPLAEDRSFFNTYLSAVWMPMIPIYYREESPVIGRHPSAMGAALRLGVLYSGFDFINTGMELAGSRYSFKADSNGNERSLQHAATIGFNLVAQKLTFNRRIALTFRLGGGLTFLPGIEESVPLGQSFFLNVGASFFVFATEHLYLETGLDHAYLFTNEISGCLRPWLGLGWQF